MKRFKSKLSWYVWRIKSRVYRTRDNVRYLGLLPYVNIYEIWQNYGGPEEGGWWYECGSPLYSVRLPYPIARIFSSMIWKRYKDYGRKWWYPHPGSLDGNAVDISDGKVVCYIEPHPAQGYPQERPYYC